MSMRDTEGYKKEFIIFRDDNDSIKTKIAFVKPQDHGFWIMIEDASPFWINSTQMLKRKTPKEDNGYH